MLAMNGEHNDGNIAEELFVSKPLDSIENFRDFKGHQVVKFIGFSSSYNRKTRTGGAWIRNMFAIRRHDEIGFNFNSGCNWFGLARTCEIYVIL